MPAPYMFDKAGNESKNIKYKLEKIKEYEYILYIEPDSTWINRPEREFPVVIDPTVVISGTNDFIYKIVSDTVNYSGESSFYKSEGNYRKLGYFMGNASSSDAAKLFGETYLYIGIRNIKELYKGRVDSAVLFLPVLAGPEVLNTNGYFSVYGITEENWYNQTLDWKNKPAEDEYSIVAHAVPEQYSASEPDRLTPYYLKIDLTAALSSDYAGFVIKADQPTSGNSNVQNSILVPSSGSNEGVQFIVSYTAKNRLSVGRTQTQSCNRAGTGTIDLYSGELNFEHVDLNLSGTQLPINITHIYNSNNYSKESDYTYKCGAGWRMSFMQTLKKQSALVGKNYGDGEAVCYEYIDAAGKSHEISTRYYKNYTTGSGSSLKSYKIYGQYEEDKGFKAEISNDTYVLTKDGQNLILTDEAGNVLKFDESTGRIVAVIKAGDGMRFDIWYGENYIEMYDTNYRTVRFNFENNYLKEIIFNSETVCSFTYKTVYGLTALSKISYGAENSEYYSTFDYDSSRGNLFKITDPAGLILEYKHNFDKKLYTTGYYIKTETDNICYNSNTNAGISTGSLKVADEVTITYNTRLTSGQRYPELPYAEYSIDNFTTVTNYAGAKSYFIFGADGSLQMSYDEKGNIEAIHTSSKIEKINDCNVVESTIMSASVLGTAGIFDDGEINHENYFDGYYFTQRQKRDYATYNNPASGWYLLVAALEGVLISGDSVNSLDSAVSKHIPYAVIKVVKTKTDGTKEEEFACFNASVSGMAKSQLAVLPFYVGRRNEDENNDYSDVVSMTISGEVYGNPNNVNITGWQLRKAAVGSKAVIHDKDYVLTQSYKNKFKVETTTDITKRSGNKIVSTQKRGSETVQSTSTYDSYNRIKEQINGLGVVSTYTYQNGNLVAEEVASGGEKMRKEYNYDSSEYSLLKYNALISATDESNNTVDYQYDSYGYVKRLTYPQISQNIDYTYNGIEGLLKEVKAVANSSQFVETTSNTMSYNKGYLTRLKHSGCTYDFTYDGFGRITNVYLGNVAIIKAAYTDNGTNIDGVTGATKKTITGYYGMIKPYGKFIGNIYAGNVFASSDLDEPVVYASYYNKYGEIIEVRRAFGEDITHTFTSSERYISVSETLNNGVRSVTYSVGESRYVYEYDAFTGEQKSSTEYNGTTEKIKFRTVSQDAFGRTAEDNISVDGGSLSCSYSYAYKDKTDAIETINLKKNNAAVFSSGITADGFGRVKNRQFKIGSNVLLKEEYLYNGIVKSGVTYETPRVFTATLTAGQSSRGYKYTYGVNNNITAINNLSNNLIVSYAYDGLNRLIRENVVGGNITVYKYDAGGNIRYKKIFPYSSYSGQSTLTLLGSSAGKTINYGYSSTVGDRLISYNGSETVEYDNFGNPQKWFKHGTNSSSLGYTLTWEECTQLASITDDSTGALYSYKYNDQGIRTEKTVGGVTHSYYLNGTQIISEKIGNNTLLFYYDSTGVCGFNYNGTDYYYQKNIQGDIERIYNNQGALYAEYSYDAWGKCTIKSNVNNIAAINPFRYRGYYLDDETGLYYLNARYYDPEIGRFISPDSTEYLEAEKLHGLNLYVYCLDNPIIYVDYSGHALGFILIFAVLLIGFVAGAIINGVSSYNAGNRGLDLLGDIFLGGSIGLAIAGLGLALTGIGIQLVAGAGFTLLGVTGMQMFALGAAAFDAVAFIAGPIFGFEMQPIEYETPSKLPIPDKVQPTPPHPGYRK